MKEALFQLSDEFEKAVAGCLPVVFLESTVIAQGLPWPVNHETAVAMETTIRDAGAVPAMVAVLEGTLTIGVGRQDLERMARSAEVSAVGVGHRQDLGLDSTLRWNKANRRDLGIMAARGTNAATTVSATLWAARRAANRPCVLATGGVGGVHREAATRFDISTDLDELAHADGCVVVCSGFKSILDLPATLEVLETRGVPVIGYRTGELPAFTTMTSGLPLEHRADRLEQAAKMVAAHRTLGLPGAIVLAQPPPPGDALDPGLFARALKSALDQARDLRIAGKALTPFLLESLHDLTGGQSLRANCALLVANARLAAELVVALHLENGSRSTFGDDSHGT